MKNEETGEELKHYFSSECKELKRHIKVREELIELTTNGI